MYQQIILIGNLGADPEMRFTQGGTPVTSLRLATSKQWTTPDGEKREKTTWFRVTVWREAAKACAEYLVKGSKVMVMGEIEEPNVYVNKAGDPAASLEVTAREVKFLSSKPQSDSGDAWVSAQRQSPAKAETKDEDIPF